MPKTEAIIKIFEEKNIKYKVVNNIDKTIKKSEIKGIILTGSALKLTQRIRFKDYVHDLYYLNEFNVPILGICFGCQLLHLLNNGKLENTGNKLFCNSFPVELSNHQLFKSVNKNNKNNKNNNTTDIHFCFSDLPLNFDNDTDIKNIAWFDFKNNKIPCAFQYKKYIFGLLFHPDSLENTHQILYNFNYICENKSIKTKTFKNI